jgi:hypothetical protein
MAGASSTAGSAIQSDVSPSVVEKWRARVAESVPWRWDDPADMGVIAVGVVAVRTVDAIRPAFFDHDAAARTMTDGASTARRGGPTVTRPS